MRAGPGRANVRPRRCAQPLRACADRHCRAAGRAPIRSLPVRVVDDLLVPPQMGASAQRAGRSRQPARSSGTVQPVPPATCEDGLCPCGSLSSRRGRIGRIVRRCPGARLPAAYRATRGRPVPAPRPAPARRGRGPAVPPVSVAGFPPAAVRRAGAGPSPCRGDGPAALRPPRVSSAGSHPAGMTQRYEQPVAEW